MNDITVERNPSPAKLDAMGVDDWPEWRKEESVFPWTYDTTEVCYITSGEAVVTPDGGEPVTIKRGDLVNFAAGLSCRWDIRKAIRKNYRLG